MRLGLLNISIFGMASGFRNLIILSYDHYQAALSTVEALFVSGDLGAHLLRIVGLIAFVAKPLESIFTRGVLRNPI